jgi:AAA+ ATPase superfamily predicted ATPase
MRRIFLFVLLTFSVWVNAGDLGVIEKFSISNVPLYNEPSSKGKSVKVLREQMPSLIEIINEDKKYYQINYNGKQVWVKKRHVATSNIKVDCLVLSSDLTTHVAGSKALAEPEC